MILKTLNNYHGLDNYHFLGWYFPKNQYEFVRDQLSRAILKFKECDAEFVQKWIAFATNEIEQSTISPNFIIHALSHNEMHSNQNSSLGLLATSLQNRISNCRYLPNSLSKIRSIDRLHTMNRAARNNEINQAYKFNKPQNVNGRFLIIDDIMTTGTTMKEIARAIRVEIPDCAIHYFTLLKTYDKRYDARSVPNHVPYYFGLMNLDDNISVKTETVYSDDDLPF